MAKKSGSIRICVDFCPLNNNVLREVHPIPKVDETLGQLAGAILFSKVDANCGFWQIPLEKSTPSGYANIKFKSRVNYENVL